MPLSEQEQRLLEEMERSLYHNDADFVAGPAGAHGRPTYTMVVTGILIGVVGVATLITGVAVRLPIVGVVGFIIMFAGVLILVTPARGGSNRGQSSHGSGSTGAAGSGADSGASFRQNGNDQWENRPDDQDE